MFNSALMPNWATFADDLISAPMITPTAEWQEMDGQSQWLPGPRVIQRLTYDMQRQQMRWGL